MSAKDHTIDNLKYIATIRKEIEDMARKMTVEEAAERVKFRKLMDAEQKRWTKTAATEEQKATMDRIDGVPTEQPEPEPEPEPRFPVARCMDCNEFMLDGDPLFTGKAVKSAGKWMQKDGELWHLHGYSSMHRAVKVDVWS